jgi:hypothetical protein
VLLLGDLSIEAGVVDVVAVACVAVDGVAAAVGIALEGDAHRTLLRAAAQEVVLRVVEHVEERPRDGFEDGRLARAVRADDGGRPAPEVERLALVSLDVVEFDSCDVHEVTVAITR